MKVVLLSIQSIKNMNMQQYDSAESGYLVDAFEGMNLTFTEVEVLWQTKCHQLARAKRYGRWWMLKSLKPEFAGQAIYRQMVRKEVDDFTYNVEPKVDGVSMSLFYEDRRLVRAATRGNGQVGDDVTLNVKTIRAVPLRLPPSAPESLEVRGEVYMTRDGFVKLNEREEESGREPFANPRNAAAGSLKLLDSKEVANRPLDIVIYNAGGTGCEGFSTHSEMIETFRSWGFPVTPWSKTCATMEDVYAAIDLLTCVSQRNIPGGPAPEAVKKTIEATRAKLG